MFKRYLMVAALAVVLAGCGSNVKLDPPIEGSGAAGASATGQGAAGQGLRAQTKEAPVGLPVEGHARQVGRQVVEGHAPALEQPPAMHQDIASLNQVAELILTIVTDGRHAPPPGRSGGARGRRRDPQPDRAGS